MESLAATTTLHIKSLSIGWTTTLPSSRKTALGAAGALELGFCCLVLSDSNPDGLLPAHLYDGERDLEIPEIRLVRPGDSCKGIRRIQSNSFAFGGCNVSLIVEKV